MNVLVTSARMPFALDEIRKLGRRGHRVFAADTFRAAPGCHSRWAAASLLTASPQYATARFLDDVKQIILARDIELLVPGFEEVFYLAQHAESLSQIVQLFAPPLDVLERLHDKALFNALARELGLAAPPTVRVASHAELVQALTEFPRWLARPVFSRGGLELLTNAGPLAGVLRLEDCRPTEAHPWIVQAFVDGEDVCCFGLAHAGRVTAFSAYRHPMEIEHGGGIVFESIDEPAALAAMQRVAEATRYHGQLALDFRRAPDGQLELIECNPRPTAGVHLMDDATLVDAMLAPKPGPPRVAPPGVRRMYGSAVLRDLLLHGGRVREHLEYLFAPDVGDVFGEAGDRVPALYQALSYVYVVAYRARHRRPVRPGISVMAAYFDGIEWNGEQAPLD